MKQIFFLLIYFFASIHIAAQINIDSICKDCERIPKQDCKYYGLTITKLNNKKLVKDLKVLSKVEKYINSKDTSFKKIYSKAKRIEFNAKNGNMNKTEEVKLNYFDVGVYTIKVNDSVVKGYHIGATNTVYCKEPKDIPYIDERILKQILTTIKLPYHLIVCGKC